jgi:hypothetical protein
MCNEEHTDAALEAFMKRLLPVTARQAPVKKLTVRTAKSPWIDDSLINCMAERDEAKEMANTVPSESTQTRRLFPHFVILQPYSKID